MVNLIKDFEIKIDPTTSIAYVRLSNREISNTESINDSINADIDLEGHIVGLEVLDIESFKTIGDLASKWGLSRNDIEAILSELEAQY